MKINPLVTGKLPWGQLLWGQLAPWKTTLGKTRATTPPITTHQDNYPRTITPVGKLPLRAITPTIPYESHLA